MKQRFLSGAVLTAVLLLFALFSGYTPVPRILAILLAVSSLTEILYMSGWIRSLPVLLTAAASAVAIPLLPPVNETAIPLTIAAVILIFALAISAWVSKFSISQTVAVVLIVLLVPLFFSALVALRERPAGLCWFCAVFVAAWSSDVGGYVFGRIFGKYKLAPKISPNKTVEGLIGCYVTGAAGLLIAGFVSRMAGGYEVNLLSLAVCSLIGTTAGVLGDLSASAVKRRFGIKDFGKLIPGHGGIMDRFDSVLFVAPVFWLYAVVTDLVAQYGWNWTVFMS